MAPAPAPLFRDPIYDGAADPVIVWNRQEQSWWILYTNRRANVPCRGVAWVHGTDIGIASSTDGGHYWTYRGIAQGLPFERGLNSFWAPEIFWHGDRYHMYVSYVPGVPHTWHGPRHIHHYTSANLWDWAYQSRLPLSSDNVIDACVYPLPGGGWRMWYKDEAHHSHTYAADSDDLYRWQMVGPVLTDFAHEGPNVFYWRDAYWMVVDAWRGQGVYRSPDAERWTYQGTILTDPGTRPDDSDMARHGDVLVQGEEAYFFYFTHPGRGSRPGRDDQETAPYEHKRSSLQVAKFEIDGAGTLICRRNEPFDFALATPG